MARTDNIPMFDGMCIEDIQDWLYFVGYTGNISREISADIVGDKRKGYTRIARNVRAYAINKLTAMKCRVRGDIQSARLYESICDRIYSQLPTDLRW